MIARFSRGARIVTLYGPVGPKELELIAATEWHEFSPRLPAQPIFYPVTNEAYATQIARDWNVKSDGDGFMVKFDVDAYYPSQYSVQKVGAELHTEYWIPAEDLAEFNHSIVGQITVIDVSTVIAGLGRRPKWWEESADQFEFGRSDSFVTIEFALRDAGGTAQ